MSTYTDLHIRKKENLTVLRMPGNPYDGLTPQRVIFENPENRYNGTFVGTLSATDASFNNVTLTDCTLVNGVLSDVMFKYGNETIALTTLTTDISEMQDDIDNLQKFQTSVETSCQTFSENISILNISTEWLSGYADDLSDAIEALSSSGSSVISSIDSLSIALSGLSDEFNEYVASNDIVISTLSDDLYSLSDNYTTYVKQADNSISTISDDLSSLSDEFIDFANETNDKIETIQKQVAGGVVYKGSLSIDYISLDYGHTLPALLSVNGQSISEPLSIGYFFVTQTSPENRLSHFIYDGVELENGDWLMINNNCYVSSITSNDVDVVDAQDYDNFKLLNNNVAVGNNEFNGETTFNGNVQFNQLNEFNGNSLFNANVDINSQLNSTSLSVKNATIDRLSIELSNVNYGISSLQDLSNDFQSQLTGIDSKIIALSNELNKTSTVLSNDISYLSSELSNYHNTLSGIDRANDDMGDIKSDNLIITDVLLPGGQQHSHKQYYMTFLSGTIVLKPIQ